jgi:hypothetical protein
MLIAQCLKLELTIDIAMRVSRDDARVRAAQSSMLKAQKLKAQPAIIA